MNALLDLLEHTIEEMGFSAPKYVLADDSLEKAIKLMQEHKIGSALVIDDKVHLKGILTERDVLMKVAAREISLQDKVSQFMTKNPMTVKTNESVFIALAIMSREGFRHLPIVNFDGKPVGIISMKDVMGYFANHLHERI